MIDKFLVIGGCPRSGTTLLNILINTHPDVFITNELNIIKFSEKLDALFYREQSSLSLKERKKSRKETWTLSDLTCLIPRKSPNLYAEILKVFFHDMSQCKNLILIGDKVPKYYHNYNQYNKFCLANEMYYLHVSRNPLNVLNSFIRIQKNNKEVNDYFNTNLMPEEILNEWILAWNFINKEQHVHHIKYESLLNDSNSIFSGLSNYLCIPNAFESSSINNFEDEIILDNQTINLLPPKLIELSKSWLDLDFSHVPPHLQHIDFVKLSYTSVIKKFIRRILK